jgi:hypothetical protein
MLTKQDLEDIWNNKPYGYFTNMMKNMKGKKKYKVLCTAYEEVDIAKEESVVFAKSGNEAIRLASNDLRVSINKTLGKSTSSNVNFRYKVEWIS